MNLDAPVIFVLKHQEQIEEWHAVLRDKVRPAADRFFRSLEGRFQTLADSLDGGPRLYVQLEEPWPQFFLHRPEWTGNARRPRVGIGLEWNRRNVDFRSSYIGVWVDKDQPGGPEIRATIAAELRAKGSDYQSMASTAFWAGLQTQTPSSNEYWNHLDAFGDELVAGVQNLWQAAAPLVDRAVSRYSEGAGP